MLINIPTYSITLGTKIEVVKVQRKCYFEQNPQSCVALFDFSPNKRKGKNASLFYEFKLYLYLYSM